MDRTLRLLGVLLLTAVAGCAQHSTPPIPATSASAATGPTPPSSPSRPQPLGTSQTLTDPGLALDVTVFTVEQNLLPDTAGPAGGGHWAAADAQTCLRQSGTDFTVGWGDWSVSDGTTQYPASTARLGEFPIPQFPTGPESIAVGECTRGWVVFAVGYGADVTTVRYRPAARSPLVWSAS